MYKRLTWEDILLVHEISRKGTLTKAARALRVSHPTVFRKLNAAEERLGVRFFQRSRAGYTPTRAAEEVCRLYDKLRDELDVTERRITGQDLRPSGIVRVTTTDSLLFGWLSTVLAEFRQKYPEIRLAVVLSNDYLDLTKREADIAVRPSISPPNSMSSKRIGVIRQAIYVSEALLISNKKATDLTEIVWIGPDDSIHYPTLQMWLQTNAYSDLCHYRSNSVLDMFVAARNGVGAAVLPCYLADPCDGLVRCGDSLPELGSDLWLVTHPDLRQTERIRLLFDWIEKHSSNVFDNG